MELRRRENFVLGPDGENGRQEAIDEQQRQQRFEADYLRLMVGTSLMILLKVLLFGHFFWVALDVLAMAVSVKSTLQLSTTMRILYLLAALLPPATSILIYHISTGLEQPLFELIEVNKLMLEIPKKRTPSYLLTRKL